MRGAVAEAERRLRGPHLVGQGPSSRHDDDRPWARGNDIEPGGRARGERTTLPPSFTTTRPGCGARPRLEAFGRQSLGRHQVRSRRRTISTPTAPGSLSSFSILTLTEAARGWERQRVAISSARVSTRLM